MHRQKMDMRHTENNKMAGINLATSIVTLSAVD